MSLYVHSDYRSALKWLIEDRKRTMPELNQAKLAEAVGVHSTYITNVFKQRADLSSDQLFVIIEHLALTDIEGEYLQLLLEKDRTGIDRRKKALQEKIEQFQNTQLSPKQRLKVKSSAPDDLTQMQFYLEPLTSVIHLALRLPRYRSSLEALAEDVGLNLEQVGQCVQVLERLGIVEYNASTKTYIVHNSGTHLPKTHPMCAPHQELMRMRSAHHIATRKPKIQESFMSSFPANKEVIRQLHDQFLEFAENGGNLLSQQKEHDGIYQLNFDLFQWI